MTQRNPNYDEKPLQLSGNGDSPVVTIDPPSARTKGRGATSGRRSAAPGRKQLVVLAIDDSASMKRAGKCQAASEASQEVVVQAKMKSLGGKSCFDFFIFGYGDYVFVDERLSFRPVEEIDEEYILFDGSSGGTRIKQAMRYIESDVLGRYDREYLQLHPEPNRVPPPLIFVLSDGYNGDGVPLPITDRLKATPLSIGVPPLIVTVGIEYGGGEPHVELLSRMASQTSDGMPLYFDISSASELVELLATQASSAATSADDLYRYASTARLQITDARKEG